MDAAMVPASCTSHTAAHGRSTAHDCQYCMEPPMYFSCFGAGKKHDQDCMGKPGGGRVDSPTTHTVLDIPVQSGAWVNTFWETVSPGMLPDLNIRRTNCETDEQEFRVASKHGVALPLYGGHLCTACFARHAVR